MTEKTLGDFIFSVVRVDNTKEINNPPHMDPCVYEDDDMGFCPFCGKELEDEQRGFCSEQCELDYYDVLHLDRHAEEEERRDKCQR